MGIQGEIKEGLLEIDLYPLKGNALTKKQAQLIHCTVVINDNQGAFKELVFMISREVTHHHEKIRKSSFEYSIIALVTN